MAAVQQNTIAQPQPVCLFVQLATCATCKVEWHVDGCKCDAAPVPSGSGPIAVSLALVSSRLWSLPPEFGVTTLQASLSLSTGCRWMSDGGSSLCFLFQCVEV
jgi:hypothetical protein